MFSSNVDFAGPLGDWLHKHLSQPVLSDQAVIDYNEKLRNEQNFVPEPRSHYVTSPPSDMDQMVILSMLFGMVVILVAFGVLSSL